MPTIRKEIRMKTPCFILLSSKYNSIGIFQNPDHTLFSSIFICLHMSAPRLSDSGKRLLRDLRNLHKDPPAGIMASPIDSDIYVRIWTFC